MTPLQSILLLKSASLQPFDSKASLFDRLEKEFSGQLVRSEIESFFNDRFDLDRFLQVHSISSSTVSVPVLALTTTMLDDPEVQQCDSVEININLQTPENEASEEAAAAGVEGVHEEVEVEVDLLPSSPTSSPQPPPSKRTKRSLSTSTSVSTTPSTSDTTTTDSTITAQTQNQSQTVKPVSTVIKTPSGRTLRSTIPLVPDAPRRLRSTNR